MVNDVIVLYLYYRTLGWVLPYLCMVGRFHADDPRFGDFQSDWVPILYLNTIQLTLTF